MRSNTSYMWTFTRVWDSQNCISRPSWCKFTMLMQIFRRRATGTNSNKWQMWICSSKRLLPQCLILNSQDWPFKIVSMMIWSVSYWLRRLLKKQNQEKVSDMGAEGSARCLIFLLTGPWWQVSRRYYVALSLMAIPGKAHYYCVASGCRCHRCTVCSWPLWIIDWREEEVGPRGMGWMNHIRKKKHCGQGGKKSRRSNMELNATPRKYCSWIRIQFYSMFE